MKSCRDAGTYQNYRRFYFLLSATDYSGIILEWAN